MLALVMLFHGCDSHDSALAPPANAAVYVRRSGDSLFVARTMQLVAVATGPDSAAVAWPSFQWSSSDTTVAVVDSTGVVLGLGEGTTVMIAKLGALQDSVALRVVMQRADGGVAFQSLATGEDQNCALTAAGVAACRMETTTDTAPTYHALPAADFLRLESLSATRHHQCGLTSEGAMHCWGWNNQGQFLTGSVTPQNVSAPAGGGGTRRFLGIGLGATSGTSAAGHSCGIDKLDSLVVCAGANGRAQLGRVPPPNASTIEPAVLPTLDRTKAITVDAANFRTCVIDVLRAVQCWGGPNATLASATSRQVFAGPTVFLHVANDNVCMIGVDAGLRCAATTDVTAPHLIAPTIVAASLRFAMVTSGITYQPMFFNRGVYVCGVTLDGALYCWGDFPPRALSERLGNRRFSPVPIAPHIKFQSVTGDFSRLCGLTTDRRILCM